MRKLFRKKESEGKEKLPKKEKKPKDKKKLTKSKQTREIRFSKRKIRNVVTWSVFLVVFSSLFFNVIFFNKYQTIRNNVQASEDRVEEKLYEVEEKEDGFSDAIVTFGEDFLGVYYNVPAEQEEREKRLGALSNYFVNGFKTSELEVLEDFKGERVLNDIRYLETEYVGSNKVNLVYEVSYTINEIKIVEKEVEKKVKDGDDEKTVTETIEEEEEHPVKDAVQVVVPVITDGEGFAVYEKPSLTSRDFISDISIDETPLEGEDISTTDRDQLNDFLHDFFTSYGLSDEKLPYMADVEQGLQGKILSDLVIKQSNVTDEGIYQLIVDVVYQNEETTFNGMYTYYLEATKDKNSYFIENIKQGGF